MARTVLIACFALIAACTTGDSGDDSTPTFDAPPGGAAFGQACTTVSDSSSECESGVCTNSFDQIGHPVCSVKCTILMGNDPVCPSGSMGQFCNRMGYCRP